MAQARRRHGTSRAQARHILDQLERSIGDRPSWPARLWQYVCDSDVIVSLVVGAVTWLLLLFLAVTIVIGIFG